MDDISVHEFLVQLGPAYLEYEHVFLEEEFRDCSTLRTMDIETDLVQMFKDKGVPLPLGHRRRLEDALRNIKCAGDQSVMQPGGTIATTGCERGNTASSLNGFENIIREKEAQLAAKMDERKELELKKRELTRDIPFPPPVGNNKTSTCSNCHIRGHRQFGNKHQLPCKEPPCPSWLQSGNKKRHHEHGLELVAVHTQLVKLGREILDLETQIKNDNGFKEKLSASFVYEVKPRLKKLDPKKYSDVNLLTRDLLALKSFYKGKIPSHSEQEDETEFKKSLKSMEEKKSKSFTIKSEDYDNVSDDEPPTKAAFQHQPTSHSTLHYDHQTSYPTTTSPYDHQASYSTYGQPYYYSYSNTFYDPRMYPIYPSFPNYYQTYQPPLPTYPPPCSSPPPPPTSTPPSSPKKESK